MWFPGNYESILGGGASDADPKSSSCGRQECMTLPIPVSESPNAQHHPSVHLYCLEHGTAAHQEAMKPGGNIAKIDEASVPPAGHECELVELGQSLSITNVHPIHAACFAGNIEGVRNFINEHGVDYFANLRIGEGRNIPEFAARGNQLDILKMLHGEFNISLDVVNTRGASPLTIAAQENHDAVIRFLLDEAKVNPHAVTNQQRNLLSYTQCFHSNLDLTRYAHEKYGCMIHPADNDRTAASLLDDVRRNPKKNMAALRYAVDCLGLKFPEKYESGLRENQPGDDIFPPLLTAAITADEDVALELIDIILKDAPNVDVLSWCGLSALHAAGSVGHLRVIKALRERGATVPQTKVGSPLHHTCLSLSPEVVKYFCDECKIDPNCTVPLAEVKPLHLLISTFKARAVEELQTMAKLAPLQCKRRVDQETESKSMTTEQKFLRCLYIMLRNGYENALYEIPRSYLPERAVPYYRPAAVASSSSPSSSGNAAARSSRGGASGSRGAGGASQNQLVLIDELIVIQPLPLSSLWLCFDFGHRLHGYFCAPVSAYNSAASSLNVPILRMMDELGFTGQPDEGLVSLEYALISTNPDSQRTSGLSAADLADALFKEASNDEDNDNNSKDEEVKKKEPSAQRNGSSSDKTKQTSEVGSNDSEDDVFGSPKKKKVVAGKSKIKAITDLFTRHARKYKNVVLGSPNDPCACSVLRYIRSKRTCLGKFISCQSNRNSSLTIDGIAGFAQNLVSEFFVCVLAKSGLLCNKNRWNGLF